MSDASGIRRKNAATVRSRLDPADKAPDWHRGRCHRACCRRGAAPPPNPERRGRRARPPCALVLLASRFGCFLPRCLSLGGIGRSRDGGFLSVSLPGRRFPRGGLAGRGLPRDGPSRPRGPRRRLRLLPRRAGRRLCLLGLLLGRLGLALLRRGVLLRRGCGFGLFQGCGGRRAGQLCLRLGRRRRRYHHRGCRAERLCRQGRRDRRRGDRVIRGAGRCRSEQYRGEDSGEKNTGDLVHRRSVSGGTRHKRTRIIRAGDDKISPLFALSRDPGADEHARRYTSPSARPRLPRVCSNLFGSIETRRLP